MLAGYTTNWKTNIVSLLDFSSQPLLYYTIFGCSISLVFLLPILISWYYCEEEKMVYECVTRLILIFYLYLSMYTCAWVKGWIGSDGG